MKIARIEDEDDDEIVAPESMFEDEIVSAPTTTTQPVAASQRSVNSSLFDPFAPVTTPAAAAPPTSIATAIPLDELYNSNHGSNNNNQDTQMVDRFEDEDEPEAASYKKNSSRSVEDGPVLIPMNPDADADLLGSIALKHASKAKKDSKIKDITYQDDGDLLMLDSDPKKKKKTEEADDDKFVDDEQAPTTGGGLFSRLRSKIVAAATTPTGKADAKPPKAEAELPPRDSAIGNLVDGGNSLPHPDSVRHGSTRDKVEESDSEDEAALDENGNSLPHPDEMVRLSGAATKTTEDKNLDANGNSLPHPDEMVRLSGAAGRPFGDENLDANGNSLPHPNEMVRFSGAAGRSTEEDVLDANGNSLPHPDTLMGVEEAMLLNDALGRTSSHEDTGSERSNNERLMAALAETESNVSDDDSDDDYYNVTTDDEDVGKGLEDNGNSLAPPSGEKLSSRWGKFRSPFSSAKKSKRDPEAAAADDSDEESFQDEEKPAPSSDRDLLDLVNNDGLAFDENGNPLPSSSARNFNEEKKRKFTLHSMGQSVANAFRPNKARGQEGDNTRSGSLFADADEENIFGNHLGNRDDDEDDFDDETDKDKLSSLSKKERLQNMLREHKNNPRSRKIGIIAIAAFLLFLVILIPLVTRNKNSKQIESPPEPNTATVLGSPDCVDEIVLTDKFGEDKEISPLHTPCYLNTEPIYFRYKRCRPASVQDWVGVYPAGSMFMDRLWKDWYDGVYLCGNQPCSGEEPPLEQKTMSPPIPDTGNYRLFLIKDSNWPFEFIKYTPSFQVVDDDAKCPVDKPDGVAIAPPALFDDQATAVPTSTSTYASSYTSSYTGSYTSSYTNTGIPFPPLATFYPTSFGTGATSSTGTGYSTFTGTVSSTTDGFEFDFGDSGFVGGGGGLDLDGRFDNSGGVGDSGDDSLENDSGDNSGSGDNIVENSDSGDVADNSGDDSLENSGSGDVADNSGDGSLENNGSGDVADNSGDGSLENNGSGDNIFGDFVGV